MTRLNHSILFFFAIAVALLSSAVMMLYLASVWADAQFVTLVLTALVVSLAVPAAAAAASLRYIEWQQPLTAWLVFYLMAAIIALTFGRQLLE